MNSARSLVKLQTEGVVQDNPDVLKGVVIAEVGEVHPAEGPAFFLDLPFIKKLVQTCLGKSLKVRVNHPGSDGADVMAMVGKAVNFRVDGQKARADIELFDVEEKSRLQEYALKAAEHFGMSLVMSIQLLKKKVNGLKTAMLHAVDAVDFVDKGAATKSLFCRKVDSKTSYMNLTLEAEHLEALGLDPEKADEKSCLAAVMNMAEEHKDMKEKLEAEGGEGDETPEEKEKREKAEAEEGDETPEEKKEKAEAAKKAKLITELAKKFGVEEKQIGFDNDGNIVIKAAASTSTGVSQDQIEDAIAKATTRVLASCGIKPKASAPKGKNGKEEDEEPTVKLSAQEKADCAKLGITEEVAIKNILKFKAKAA